MPYEGSLSPHEVPRFFVRTKMTVFYMNGSSFHFTKLPDYTFRGCQSICPSGLWV